MGKFKIIFFVLSAMILAASCKIQDAPGAYLPAKGQKKSALSVEEPVAPPVVPKPDVKEEPEPEPQPVKEEPEAVQEPELVNIEDYNEPEPVVEEATVQTEPEVTRKEQFDVVAGQTDVDLRNYHVVIGSFGKQNNAINLQSQMRQEGYKPVVVVNKNGMYRVILQSFDTYQGARTKISEIVTKFPDAWVLVQQK
ncbi:MAG: SPOR domain-containing protein [bacterium]